MVTDLLVMLLFCYFLDAGYRFFWACVIKADLKCFCFIINLVDAFIIIFVDPDVLVTDWIIFYSINEFYVALCPVFAGLMDFLDAAAHLHIVEGKSELG